MVRRLRSGSSSSSASDDSRSRSSRRGVRSRSQERRVFSRTPSRLPRPRPPPGHVPGAGVPQDPVQLFNAMKTLMLEQFQEIGQALADQKEFEEKFAKSSVNFAQKPLEKQFEVNSNILATNHKIQKALKKRDYKKAKKLLQEQEDDLIKHEEDPLTTAGSWLAKDATRSSSNHTQFCTKAAAVPAAVLEWSAIGIVHLKATGEEVVSGGAPLGRQDKGGAVQLLP